MPTVIARRPKADVAIYYPSYKENFAIFLGGPALADFVSSQ